MTYMTRHRSNRCNSWINWAKLSAYHRRQSQPAALSGFRGQAMSASPHPASVIADARLGLSQASRAGAAAPSTTTTSGIMLLFVVAWEH